MAAWALANKQLLISVGAAGGKRQAHKVDIDDLSATTHDPLLAQLRYRLRKHHRAARDGKKSVSPAFLAVSPWRRPTLHARWKVG